MTEIELMYQYSNLCDALQRNINDNFKSVSFEIIDSGYIQIKIILFALTEQEEEYIDDLSVEFSALQEKDIVLKPMIEMGDCLPLKNIVYQLG